jgi:hypothetical protein
MHYQISNGHFVEIILMNYSINLSPFDLDKLNLSSKTEDISIPSSMLKVLFEYKI